MIKRIAHLDDEVAQLESCWARELENTSIYSTASHLHLYGLLFGVLWPLCSGRPFAADRPLYPGQLLSRMKARERCVLVSVPVSLRPLARHGGAADLAGRCETMFSSGGPLPPETAHELAAVVGRAPIEVFGSTETGGIAHRRLSDDAEDEWWRPFPNVRIEALPDEEDDRYEVTRVHSPLVSGGDGSSSHCTGDRIELRADGRFRLGGRSNLVAKIGEKRLDMAQMASQLMGHPFVDEVALTTVQRDADTRVAAVVIASDRGHEVLEIRGRRAFARALCDDLMANWDPILHPRLWRVVDALPVDARGKVSQELLRPLFEAVQAEPRQSDRPRIIEEQRGEGSAEWLCEVPADLECFAGHFPGIPVVPGVVQLDWVMALLAGLRGAAPRLRRIELVKFMTPLVPGDRFRLGVRVREAGPTGAGGTVVVFDLADGERAISRGRLVIAEDPVSEVDGEAS